MKSPSIVKYLYHVQISNVKRNGNYLFAKESVETVHKKKIYMILQVLHFSLSHTNFHPPVYDVSFT